MWSDFSKSGFSRFTFHHHFLFQKKWVVWGFFFLRNISLLFRNSALMSGVSSRCSSHSRGSGTLCSPGGRRTLPARRWSGWRIPARTGRWGRWCDPQPGGRTTTRSHGGSFRASAVCSHTVCSYVFFDVDLRDQREQDDDGPEDLKQNTLG